MSYRKLKAEFLFDGFRVVAGNPVLICRTDGTIEEIVDESAAGGDIEKFRGMISPGFINCHCHLELSHLQGLIPEHQGLVNFVLAVMGQRYQEAAIKQDAMTRAEMAQDAMMRAERAMAETGIVAVGDICNTADTLAIKAEKKLSYYNFIEVLGWSPELAPARFEFAMKLAGLFAGLDETHLSVSPHAPYSVSAELWKMIKPGFPGKTITIHNQEMDAENEFFQTGTGDLLRMYAIMKIDNSGFQVPGTRSLPHYLPELKTAANVLLVHNTFMNEADLTGAMRFSDSTETMRFTDSTGAMRFADSTGAMPSSASEAEKEKNAVTDNALFVCLCPNANLYIENKLPDIPMFIKNKARLVLGTDSLASNHQLNILEEMKTIKNAYPFITTAEMLTWATSNGAGALSFENTLGDFKKEKKPGVVLIENITGGEIGESTTSRRIL